MKNLHWLAALVVLALMACEGKKSLDGHPMDKPPPSAYGPRDSEPEVGGNKEAEGDSGAAQPSE